MRRGITKQKCLQKSFKSSVFNIRLPQWGRWTVPNSRTRNRETPVAQSSVRSWNSENVCVSGAKLGTSGVRDQLAVVDQVRRSLTAQRLVDESGQLVVDTLLHWKPVQATKDWWGVVTSASSSQSALPRSGSTIHTIYRVTLYLQLLALSTVTCIPYMSFLAGLVSDNSRSLKKNWVGALSSPAP